jgi:multiple sugar transport system permease protein
LKMGYASAVAWLLFLLTLAITAVILGTSRRWVTYDS